MLIQQESNSFAIRPSSLGDFKIRIGKEAEEELRDTNSEFNGALREIGDRGGIAVPVIYMHALPGGVLRDDDFDQLIKTALTALNEVGHLDGLILSLHGAMATVSEPAADAILCRTFAERAKIPLALSLDLHANCTPRLVAPAKVVTGYKTNPHVDLASTGARAVAMLCATMNGTLTPRMAMATRPAIFPDEALRIETGVLGEILDHCLADVGSEIVDVSVFPTQPWLDAPGVGFTTLVTTDDDMSAAQHLADRVADEVWCRRDEFTVERLASPSECLRTALDSSLRPSIITESADAPTAGGSGDSPALLHALNQIQIRPGALVLATIVDTAVVDLCHNVGLGAKVQTPIGATIDNRFHEPFLLRGKVLRLGEGNYRLTGVGYEGHIVSMGRFAVIEAGALRLLVTGRPSWSADPGTWRHAGLEPNDADVLIVRSCTDYLANFPNSASTAMVADLDGPCTPRLSRLQFKNVRPAPWPATFRD